MSLRCSPTFPGGCCCYCSAIAQANAGCRLEACCSHRGWVKADFWAAYVLPELLLCCVRRPLSLDCPPVTCRILRGEYEVPAGASPHCLDLLQRIMTVDCDKRITIPEIMRHPWFLEDLPLGLEEANSSLLEAPLALQFCKQSEVNACLEALHSTLRCRSAYHSRVACF